LFLILINYPFRNLHPGQNLSKQGALVYTEDMMGQYETGSKVGLFLLVFEEYQSTPLLTGSTLA
jgi:hypothetical protein